MTARLPALMAARPWGRIALPPPFCAPAGERIGEIAFIPPPALDELLVKYIFTSENLSVQVHPAAADLAAAGKEGAAARGKDECWLVLAADPGAVLGIGFARQVRPADIRRAALDGSIGALLHWHPARAGDFFYVPAGTVHAIGAGISVIEVQQNCEVTYRLYDYGRGRELHLDQAQAVTRGEPYPPALHRRVPPAGHVALADGPPFRLDRLDGPTPAALRERYRGPLLVVPLDGVVAVAGEPVRGGECAVAARIDALAVPPGAQCLIAQGCAE